MSGREYWQVLKNFNDSQKDNPVLWIVQMEENSGKC